MSNKSDLGRSLYRSQFGKASRKINRNKKESMKSKTEETPIEKIFSLGALSEKNFSGIRVINNKDKEGILDQLQKKMFEEAKEEYVQLLSIPRRPKGAKSMTKEQLNAAEKENFLNWRRRLDVIEKDTRVKLTPFELNLDFWRQLWRVIERSDVLIQVVDARNPLLFRNADLESYVKEVDENKINIVLINKADFLTDKQRVEWAKYFDSLNLRIIFWSAKIAEEIRKAEKLANKEAENYIEKDSENESDNENIINIHSEDIEEKCEDIEEESEDIDEESEDIDEESEDIDEESEDIDEESEVTNESFSVMDGENYSEESDDDSSERGYFNDGDVVVNTSEMIGVDGIIKLLESIKIKTPHEVGKTTVGFVGYPNVGKSSTINAIFGQKKVSVSATPGHTKRFQTLMVTDRLTFCDCPGLVMPSVVHSKGHLMVSGILQIDTIRDYIAPINIVAEQFPRSTLEMLYGIELPIVRDGDDPKRAPTARELLSSYSYMHGMMTSKGNPNLDRAARIILKDYVDGKLLYRHPPPGVDQIEFQSAADLPENKRFKARPKPCGGKVANLKIAEPELPMHQLPRVINEPNYTRVKLLPLHNAIKKISLTEANGEAVLTIDRNNVSSVTPVNAKPWRINTKRCKREKMRRVHKDLDQHTFVYQ